MSIETLPIDENILQELVDSASQLVERPTNKFFYQESEGVSIIMIDEDEAAMEGLINGSYMTEIETAETIEPPSSTLRRSDASVRQLRTPKKNSFNVKRLAPERLSYTPRDQQRRSSRLSWAKYSNASVSNYTTPRSEHDRKDSYISPLLYARQASREDFSSNKVNSSRIGSFLVRNSMPSAHDMSLSSPKEEQKVTKFKLGSYVATQSMEAARVEDYPDQPTGRMGQRLFTVKANSENFDEDLPTEYEPEPRPTMLPRPDADAAQPSQLQFSKMNSIQNQEMQEIEDNIISDKSPSPGFQLDDIMEVSQPVVSVELPASVPVVPPSYKPATPTPSVKPITPIPVEKPVAATPIEKTESPIPFVKPVTPIPHTQKQPIKDACIAITQTTVKESLTRARIAKKSISNLPYSARTKIMKPGGFYMGQVKNGEENGFGEILYDNKTKLIGEFEDSQVIFGKFLWPNGMKYTGQFTNGEITGYGKRKYEHGEYHGHFVNGLREGHGKCRYQDGGVYEGYWKANEQHGEGKYKFSNGSVYQGKFKHNMQHGLGIYSLPNKTEIEAIFIRGKRQGTAVMTVPDGRIYDQEWDDDELMKSIERSEI